MASSTLHVLQNTNVLTWPIEWLVIAGIVVVVVLGTIRAGTGAATALALAFPIATLLYSEISHAFLLSGIISNFTQSIAQALIFGVLFVLVLVMMYRIVTCYDALTGGSVLGVLAAFSVAILLLATWEQIPSLSMFYQLSQPLAALFAEVYRFWWTLLALGILTYVRS